MKFLILCMCAGLSAAQLPNYFQGSFQVPNAPIPAPGGASPYGAHAGRPAAAAPAPAWAQQAQAAAYASPARSQWSPAPAAPQYAPAAPSYAGSVQAAPAAAPVNAVPSSYGWNVQHSSPQPQPQAVAAPAPAAAAPSYQQYAAPQAPAQYAAPQYSPAQYTQGRSVASPSATLAQTYGQPQAYAQPQAAAPVASNPVAALLRPASVHYANIGENLNGDYKFGYKTGNGDSFREESRTPDGTVMGQYGFTDADGKQRIVKYSAGVNGFQVLNDGAGPAPAAAAAAPAAPQWSQPAPAAPQNWGQPAAAPQQQWG